MSDQTFQSGAAAPSTDLPPPAPKRARASSRLSRQGDVAPSLEPRSLARHVAHEASESAQGAQVAALQSVLDGSNGQPAEHRMEALRAMLQGSSDDDLNVLRELLMSNGATVPATGKASRNPDEELAADWRERLKCRSLEITKSSAEKKGRKKKVKILEK